MSREDQSLITVTLIEGTVRTKLGTFDKKSGGAVTAESTKYRPGGMADPVSLGGPKAVENVTVSRLYKLDRDHPLSPILANAVGAGKLEIADQPLDVNKVAFGAAIILRGTLVGFTMPDKDSESSDASLFELECEVEGMPTFAP